VRGRTEKKLRELLDCGELKFSSTQRTIAWKKHEKANSRTDRSNEYLIILEKPDCLPKNKTGQDSSG